MLIDPVTQRFSHPVAQRAESVHYFKSNKLQNKLISLIHVWLKVCSSCNHRVTGPLQNISSVTHFKDEEKLLC